MGSSPDKSLSVVIFAVAYLSLMSILYWLVVPSVLNLPIDLSPSSASDIITNVKHYIDIQMTSFNALGYWNILLFSPVIVALLFIVAELGWPTWF